MPAKMNMFLTNGNPTRAQITAYKAVTLAPTPKTYTAPLNSAMVSRVHNAKAGCGSCGRH